MRRDKSLLNLRSVRPRSIDEVATSSPNKKSAFHRRQFTRVAPVYFYPRQACPSEARRAKEELLHFITTCCLRIFIYYSFLKTCQGRAPPGEDKALLHRPLKHRVSQSETKVKMRTQSSSPAECRAKMKRQLHPPLF